MLRNALLIAPLVLGLGCGDDGGDDGGTPDAAVQPDASAADAAGPDAAALVPTITAADYPVIAHGAQLILTGTDLDGATEVSIGGVAHANLANVMTDSITVLAVDPAVAVGLTVPVTATTPLGTSAAFDVTVIHLVISEIDPDTPGADNDEFIEIDTGLAEAVSLDGYVLALFQGAEVAGDTLNAIDLAVDTAATGLLLVGPAGMAPQIIFDGPNAIQQGEDAAAVYQFAGDIGTFPADLATIGTAGLLDAVIWESGADDVTADFSGLLTDDIVVNEGDMTAQREMVSIQRCLGDTTLQLGAAFGLLAPSPGAANGDCS